MLSALACFWRFFEAAGGAGEGDPEGGGLLIGFACDYQGLEDAG
jgi:hypothetical protein